MAVGTLGAISLIFFSNHRTEGWISRKIEGDFKERSSQFDSALAYCKRLSENEKANVSFYYKSGWDSLGIALLDSLGIERSMRIVPPDFINGLYFGGIDIAISFNRETGKFAYFYSDYATLDLRAVRIVHLEREQKSTEFGKLGNGWFYEFYEH